MATTVSNVIVLHGLTADETRHWSPWLKTELKKRGIDVHLANLPNTNNPNLDEQVAYVVEQYGHLIDTNTIIVGHSLGCLLASHAIAAMGKKIQKLICVAPVIPGGLDLDTLIQTAPIFTNAPDIKAYVESKPPVDKTANLISNTVVYLSKTDPFITNPDVVTAYYKKYFSQVICTIFDDKGHFGDKQGITQLPEILTEILSGTIFAMADGVQTVSIEEIMTIIKGPDFPTGGQMFDPDNILEVYKKGKGPIVVRGNTHFEDDKKHGKLLVIDALPYQVNKATLCETIGNLVSEKKIDGIDDVRDESSRDKQTGKDKIRIAITLHKGANADKILVQLYKMTELQTTFSINNVTLVEAGKQPRLLNIKDLLMEFVTFRRQVVYRRSVFLL